MQLHSIFFFFHKHSRKSLIPRWRTEDLIDKSDPGRSIETSWIIRAPRGWSRKKSTKQKKLERVRIKTGENDKRKRRDKGIKKSGTCEKDEIEREKEVEHTEYRSNRAKLYQKSSSIFAQWNKETQSKSNLEFYIYIYTPIRLSI